MFTAGSRIVATTFHSCPQACALRRSLGPKICHGPVFPNGNVEQETRPPCPPRASCRIMLSRNMFPIESSKGAYRTKRNGNAASGLDGRFRARMPINRTAKNGRKLPKGNTSQLLLLQDLAPKRPVRFRPSPVGCERAPNGADWWKAEGPFCRSLNKCPLTGTQML